MTNTKVTGAQIRAIVESRIEPSEPMTSILAYLKAHDGKTLTERDATNLRMGKVPGEPSESLRAVLATVRISKRAGMTSLEWGGYSSSGGNKGGSLLISYSEKGPVIDAAKVEHDFAAWAFKAREDRNAARAASLNAPDLHNERSTFQQAADAINAIHAARAVLESLTEYGGPLATECYEIKALLKDE